MQRGDLNHIYESLNNNFFISGTYLCSSKISIMFTGFICYLFETAFLLDAGYFY